jgi:hypothetical protein
MSCNSQSWVIYTIYAILFLSGLASIAVMQKAEHDQQINRIDAQWIRNARRLSFIAITGSAWANIIAGMMNDGLSPFALLLLFVSAMVLLIIDSVALDQRPPQGGRREATFGHYVLARGTMPLRHILAMLRSNFGK